MLYYGVESIQRCRSFQRSATPWQGKCIVYYFSATATIVDGETLQGPTSCFWSKVLELKYASVYLLQRSSENKIWDDKAFSNIGHCTLRAGGLRSSIPSPEYESCIDIEHSHYLKARIATPTPRRHATGTYESIRHGVEWFLVMDKQLNGQFVQILHGYYNIGCCWELPGVRSIKKDNLEHRTLDDGHCMPVLTSDSLLTL